jgi:hypothetical protein
VQNSNSVLVGVEVATYAAFLGVSGWLIRSHLSWQREIRSRLARTKRQLRKMNTRGTYASTHRVRDLERNLRDLSQIREMLVSIQQNTATMAVELENMVADIADNSRRIDRLEQDGAARRTYGGTST